MRFRRILIMLIVLSIMKITPVFSSTMYDFTTSESIVINNVPGTTELNISPLVIDNYGPALTIDNIRVEGISGWNILNYSTTDWANISADSKCLGIISGEVDLSQGPIINQGNIGVNESRTFRFNGHIGARRVAISSEKIANIITSVTIHEEPASGTTYVYQDGTLIINEQSENHGINTGLHGAVVATYPTYDCGTTWNSEETVPWLDEEIRDTIEQVYCDSSISVSDMSYWFKGCSNIRSIDFNNFDLSECTAMNHTFDGLSSFEYLDLCGLNTSNVLQMDGIFANCTSLKRIYVDDNWSTASVTQGVGVVEGSTNLIGGDGHKYDETADYSSLVYDGYDTPGFLTYNGEDKCIVTYDYNKAGYDFDSDFCNQVKSGANFSVGGASRQVHNPYSGNEFRIRGFGPSKYSRTVIAYTNPYQSEGSTMVMYAIFYVR